MIIAHLTSRVNLLEKMNEKYEQLNDKYEQLHEKYEQWIENNEPMTNDAKERINDAKEMLTDTKVRYSGMEFAFHHSLKEMGCITIIESFEMAFHLKLHESGGRKKAWMKWLKGDSVTAKKLKNVYKECKFEGGYSCERAATRVSSLYQTLSKEIQHPSIKTTIGFEIPIPFNLRKDDEFLLKLIAHVGLYWYVTFVRVQVEAK